MTDRIVFDKLISRLVLGGSYTKHADHTVSATTLRARRDEWITAGVFTAVKQAVLEACDWLIGLDLEHLSVDGCCVKAPCGGDNTGPNPTDRGKTGQKPSVLVEGNGLPIGTVLAGANRHDSPLLEPTLACLARFGFQLPDQITVHLDAGYDIVRLTLLLEDLPVIVLGRLRSDRVFYGPAGQRKAPPKVVARGMDAAWRCGILPPRLIQRSPQPRPRPATAVLPRWHLPACTRKSMPGQAGNTTKPPWINRQLLKAPLLG